MLYASKIIDRHLDEQQLVEMAAFYSWLRFTLTKAQRPVPLFFCLDFKSVFLVYGGAIFALLRNSTDYEIITIAYRCTFRY